MLRLSAQGVVTLDIVWGGNSDIEARPPIKSVVGAEIDFVA